MALKYKAGDQVRIKSLDWYNENIKNNGIIICGSESFTHSMSHFCDKVVTIVTIQDDCYRMLEDDGDWYWTDEMIEGLVEEAIEPELKFKVGDKVITDTNMKGKIIEVVEESWYRVEFEPYNGIPQPNGVVPEESMSLMEEKCNCVQVDNIPDVIQAKTSSACSHNGFYGYSDSERNETSEWYLPEGYQFTDENGNIINATKIVLEKKKKEYPKTYEECAEVLGECAIMTHGYKRDVLNALQKLIVCRDAYWKIAGEEMGLDGPWEPDWKNSEEKRYCIVNIEGDINLPEKILTKWILKVTNKILVFPTEEMRDAFYENFKEAIEICKELL